jgi:hypothetical protein
LIHISLGIGVLRNKAEMVRGVIDILYQNLARLGINCKDTTMWHHVLGLNKEVKGSERYFSGPIDRRI